MSLYDRLLGHETPHIDIGPFMAACQEVIRDRISLNPDMTTMFDLDETEENAANVLMSAWGGGNITCSYDEAFDVLILSRDNLAYLTEAEIIARLGVEV